MTKSFDALRRDGAVALAAAGIEAAAREAELLLRWASGLEAAPLSARGNEPAPEDAAARFAEGLAKRAARAPLSHVTGGREFWGRRFVVTPDVLDPRPETETLIAAALDAPEGATPHRALDLGVGSGAILGTILAELPEATGLGVDASRAALAVARANFEALGVIDRATLKIGDWLDGLTEGFDLILCNPPYIPEAELEALSPEVREHEPRLALTPGGDGLDAYRRIAPDLAAYLRRRGRALFEIGAGQADDVAAIFAAFGWPEPIRHLDMDGRERVLEWRRKA